MKRTADGKTFARGEGKKRLKAALRKLGAIRNLEDTNQRSTIVDLASEDLKTMGDLVRAEANRAVHLRMKLEDRIGAVRRNSNELRSQNLKMAETIYELEHESSVLVHDNRELSSRLAYLQELLFVKGPQAPVLQTPAPQPPPFVFPPFPPGMPPIH